MRPLLGVKRTWHGLVTVLANDPKRTSAAQASTLTPWCYLLQFANRRDDTWRGWLGVHCGEALNSFGVRNMNQAELKSPLISHLSWGHIEVEGHPPFKDTKVFPGGAREWDWRETGTHHVPGIQPADVQELIEHGAKAVVLSKGIWERLNVCPETLEVLAKSGIEVEVLQTEAAVERFNELRESMPVGGLFHSTC
jgi:hypothetical protein